MAGKKISHVQGKGSIAHNNRTFQPKNADKERKKDNITLVKEPIGKAYERIFGEAVAEYNEKQMRADRRIDDYYEHLFHRKPCNEVITGANKQKSFYEDLVQIGDMNDTPCGSEDAEIAKECLVEYLNGWKQRNPNFELFNAVMHYKSLGVTLRGFLVCLQAAGRCRSRFRRSPSGYRVRASGSSGARGG